MRPGDQIFELVLVGAAKGDRINLDAQPGCLSGVDARDYVRKLAAARYPSEEVGVDRVERYVDAPDAGARDGFGVPGELRPISRQRQLFKRSRGEMT